MTRSHHELLAHRQNTREFINEDWEEIIITRETWGRGPSGARAKTGENVLEPQRIRFITIQSGQSRDTSGEQGNLPVLRDAITAMPDADLQVGDLFQRDGQTWKIGNMDHDRDIRTLAMVEHQIPGVVE